MLAVASATARPRWRRRGQFRRTRLLTELDRPNYPESALSKCRESALSNSAREQVCIFPPDNGLSPHWPSQHAETPAVRERSGRPAPLRWPTPYRNALIARGCWVSGHYLTRSRRGQGGIHDASLFDSRRHFPIAASMYRGMCHRCRGVRVIRYCARWDAAAGLAGRPGRGRWFSAAYACASSGHERECATLSTCVSPGCSLASRADCPVVGAAAPRDPGGTSVYEAASVRQQGRAGADPDLTIFARKS